MKPDALADELLRAALAQPATGELDTALTRLAELRSQLPDIDGVALAREARRGAGWQGHSRRERRPLSALVVLALDRRRAAAVELRLTEWLDQGEDLHAPVLLRYEIANALARAVAAGQVLPERRARLESAHESSAFGRREA